MTEFSHMIPKDIADESEAGDTVPTFCGIEYVLKTGTDEKLPVCRNCVEVLKNSNKDLVDILRTTTRHWNQYIGAMNVVATALFGGGEIAETLTQYLEKTSTDFNNKYPFLVSQVPLEDEDEGEESDD